MISGDLEMISGDLEMISGDLEMISGDPGWSKDDFQLKLSIEDHLHHDDFNEKGLIEVASNWSLKYPFKFN